MTTSIGEKRLVEKVPDPVRLVIGDVVVLGLFVIVGEISHGFDPLSWRTVDSAAPFLAGWFLAAPVLGAYGVRSLTTRGTVGVTVAAWVIADVVGQFLRSTEAFAGNGSVEFFLATFFFGLLFLLPWRIAAARLGWGARRL